MLYKEKIEKQIRDKYDRQKKAMSFLGCGTRRNNEKDIQREIRRKMLSQNLI